MKAYFTLNWKLLCRDWMTYLLALLFPVLFLLEVHTGFTPLVDPRFWWALPAIVAYVGGVGLRAKRMRNDGQLLSCFSLKEARLSFFFGLVLAQMAALFLYFAVFNAIACTIYPENAFWIDFLYAELSSSFVVLLAVPAAFISYNHTLVNIYCGSREGGLTMAVCVIPLLVISGGSAMDTWQPSVFLSILFSNGWGGYPVSARRCAGGCRKPVQHSSFKACAIWEGVTVCLR